MDREHTPQKQRQKRRSSSRNSSLSNSRSISSSTSHDTMSRTTSNSLLGPPRAFRGSQRPRSRTTTPSPAPASVVFKTLLRPPVGGPPGSTGVLYEPDAPDATRHSRHRVVTSQDKDNLLQADTRLNSSSEASVSSVEQRSTRTGSLARQQTVLRLYKLSTMQQTKISPPSTSVKLITPQMQFATDLSIRLGSCLELTNFTVVGVLGLEGVGKSTVLSLLAQKNKTDDDMFITRSLESVVLDRHETTGIDLAVSMIGGAGHPAILLDSQPLLSSSMLADLLERNESQRFRALTPEQQVEVVSYQIAVFLCAICHYVLIVHDGLAFQISVNDLLCKIKQKFKQCRLPNISGNSQKHAARLLYVANNVADSELLCREDELFSAHERALEAAWSQALVRVPYKLTRRTGSVSDDASIVNTALFVLPHRQQQASHRESKLATPSVTASPASGSKKGKGQNKANTRGFVSNIYADFDDAAEDFQRFVLSLPSSTSFTSQSTSVPAGSKPLPPPHPLSLREWLSNASRVFEGVRKASCFTAECTSLRDHH
ncbi:unnamed protein product [Peronospora destructor]|uniref:Protein SMG9 n=1 Tax=Peronospora destructor TaxID=86335 RepID=A0AAV0UHH9_9STRA|nr:unnamed protein product [Peronospora destructor]